MLLDRIPSNPDKEDKRRQAPLLWAFRNRIRGHKEAAGVYLYSSNDVNPNTIDTEYDQTPHPSDETSPQGQADLIPKSTPALQSIELFSLKPSEPSKPFLKVLSGFNIQAYTRHFILHPLDASSRKATNYRKRMLRSPQTILSAHTCRPTSHRRYQPFESLT